MATVAPAPAPKNHSPRKPARQKKHWWHRAERALLYPTVLVAIITASPQWLIQYQNWRNEVPKQRVLTADDLAHLLQKNLACTSLPFTWVSNPSNIKVSTTVCNSGDVLVRASTPTSTDEFFKWVPLDDLVQTPPTSDGGGLFGAAHAATLPPGIMLIPAQAGPQPAVICQKFVNNRYLVKRLRLPNGTCVDQTFDSYRGVVTSKPAPCIATC